MDTMTIEQIHRVNKLPLNKVEKLPVLRRLSRDERVPRSCAVKEFRFPPPFTGKKKKKKRLPPILEGVFPKRHNTEEDLDVLNIRVLPPLPEIGPILSIRENNGLAQAHEKNNDDDDEDRLSEQGKLSRTFGCVREFTFPVSSAKRKRDNQMKQRRIPNAKEMPLQAKIEKLARRKRKAKQVIERKEEKRQHQVHHPNNHQQQQMQQQVSDLKFPALQNTTAFRNRKERQSNTLAIMKDSRKSPQFKPSPRPTEDLEKPRVPPRLYTKLMDTIYTYSRGTFYDSEDIVERRREPNERLPVTPVTARDERDQMLRASHFTFPPLL